MEDNKILKSYNCLNEINKNFGISDSLDRSLMNARKGISIDKDTFKKFYFIKKTEHGEMFFNVGRLDLEDRKWAKNILFSGAGGSVV